jgi:hypothetical protein
MDDYSALAQRIAVSVNGVRGSLILSRDGMVLGSYPDGDEGLAKPAWLRFVTLGEPDKSFVEFGDQVWAFVKRGSYAAFSIAEAGIRPGILVDQMEQLLVSAEAERARKGETLKVPDATAAPSGKPRTSLHPATGKSQPADVHASATADAESAAAPQDTEPPTGHGHWRRDPASTGGPDIGAGGDPATGDPAGEPPLTAAEAPAPLDRSAVDEPANAEPPPSTLKKEPHKLISSSPTGDDDDDGEVDRVLLAKEFSGLLQVDSGDDEERS